MTRGQEYTDQNIQDMDQKEFRKNFPSGWMELTRVETLILLVDVLLEAPPTREFTHNELAEKAGLNQRSVEAHIDSLVELGLVVKLEEGRETPRYTINERSPIKRRLDDLNITIQRVREGGLSKSIPEPDKAEVVERNSNDIIRGGSAEPNIRSRSIPLSS